MRIASMAVRTLVLLALTTLLAPGLAGAQTERQGFVGEVLSDIEQVESKLVGLAEAIPADKYDWRPGPGVRSVAETLMHVAADNYLLPIYVGVDAPAATGITSDYQTAVAYEKKVPDRAGVIAALKDSFAHLKKALGDTQDARLSESVNLFGNQSSVRAVWLLTAGHVHEHLGQMIAYARTNDIVPPWSRSGGSP